MLANAKFDRSTVKHGTQNMQNDCHQWLSDSFKVHQIRFRPGLHPGPHWGTYSALPDALDGLKKPTSKRDERGGGKERGTAEGREKKEKSVNGKSRPHLRKFLDPPLAVAQQNQDHSNVH